ncbi:MAG TPA: CBS domain-containing protein [Thermoanaerobaculia bacterium]|nr:CBS domain-containing protein [Thermoanaerobaculia bacterium]
MRVCDAMTPAPATCEETTSIRLAAQLMRDHDCAAIPVTDSGKLVGIITDRDIACRVVAEHADFAAVTVADCMTRPVIAVAADDPVEKAIDLMEENAVHHLPVIRDDGMLVGIVAQSDIGRRMTNREFGAMARATSIRSRRRRSFSSALVKPEA